MVCYQEFRTRGTPLATVGLSIGITGPATAPGILIVETVGMFLGRLELIVIFVGLGKMFADLKDVTHKRRIASRL